jgi:hypothetical protein
MANFNIEVFGVKEFQAALSRNPAVVEKEVSSFLVRSIALYNQGIIRDPWRIGMSGGGSPVKTGNLRDTHKRQIEKWEARIYPTAKYAEIVHESRPWLDFVKNDKDKEVEKLQSDMLNNIIKDLSK